MSTTEQLMRAEDVAQLFNVKTSTVYEWARIKFIPHIKLGGCVRFDRTAVEHWLVERRKAGRATRVPR